MAVVVPLTLIIALAAGVVAIIVAIIFSILVFREDPGNEKMVEISGYIEAGAKRFLWVQYRILSIFVLVLFIVIMLFLPSEQSGTDTIPVLGGIAKLNWKQAIAYLVGSAASMLAGYLGMVVGVKA
ncbi:MAG: sodium/proton-translocating pyrophosphatase, partial [Candidatus Heimdallarchaeota archaeon]|nr:sodium/proton-translocating pyrophosphatase [Candidatus Heimdallarchaeota archaeon]